MGLSVGDPSRDRHSGQRKGLACPAALKGASGFIEVFPQLSSPHQIGIAPDPVGPFLSRRFAEAIREATRAN
jgi:hypothetical protein